MANNAASSISLFYCYAHADQTLRDELDKHLASLKRTGLVTWHDGLILPGQEWEKEKKFQLEKADIILLLVSADFMASEYCYTKEMQQALKRHKEGKAVVVPIILRHTHWENSPLSMLEPLPAEARPIKDWTDPDKAFLDVTRGIHKIVDQVAENKARREQERQEREQKARQAKELKELQASITAAEQELRKGHAETALTMFEQILQRDKSPSITISALLGKSKAQLALKRYKQALATCEHLLRLDPKNASAYLQLGDALDRLKRKDEALAAYEQARTLAPTNPVAYRKKGDIFYHLEKYGKAVNEYNQAIHFEREHYKRDNALTRIKQGNAYYKLEKYELALAAYEKASLLDKSNALAHFKKGQTLFYLKRYEEAITAFEQTSQLEPKNADAYAQKGAALLNLLRYDDALQASEQALTFNPRNQLAQENKIVISKVGQYWQTLLDCERRIQTNPYDASAYETRGNTLFNLKRYEEALAAYHMVTYLNPRETMAYLNKALTHYRLNKYEEALSDCEQALAIDRQNALAFGIKRDALFVLGRYQEAFQAAVEVIRYKATANAYHKLGMILEELNRESDAHKAYEEARKLGYQA